LYQCVYEESFDMPEQALMSTDEFKHRKPWALLINVLDSLHSKSVQVITKFILIYLKSSFYEFPLLNAEVRENLVKRKNLTRKIIIFFFQASSRVFFFFYLIWIYNLGCRQKKLNNSFSVRGGKSSYNTLTVEYIMK
jgi:hypothetical protein